MNTDSSYINTLLAEVEELRSTKAELLAALEMLIEQVREHNQRQDSLGNCIVWDRRVDDTIAKAKGGV